MNAMIEDVTLVILMDKSNYPCKEKILVET